jgi:hypothetical protein
MIVRVLLWNLGESKTTLDELRAQLPALEPPSVWLSNEGAERFGLVLYGEQVPEIDGVRELIGRDPDAAEEFDVEVVPG